MGIGSILYYLVGLIPFEPPREEDARKVVWLTSALREFPVLHYVIKYALTWFLGMPWTSVVTNRFKQLWPAMELQIGPEHLLTEKLRRKLLATACVLGVVPLSLAVVYDLSKAFVGH